MPKRSVRKEEASGMHCNCYCHKAGWIFSLLIIIIALVPGWYGTMWAKWVIVILALLTILKKLCRCC